MPSLTIKANLAYTLLFLKNVAGKKTACLLMKKFRAFASNANAAKWDKKVAMNNLEKNSKIDYKRIDDNLKVVRDR